MKKVLSLLLTVIFVVSLAGCGSEAASSTPSDAANVTSNISSETVSEIDLEEELIMENFETYSIQKEMKTVAAELKKTNAGAVNYIFVTDTHIDSKQNENCEQVVLKELEYIVFLANNFDIDFVVIGGDLISGWYDKATALVSLQKVSEALAECKKPVIITKGNHDLNEGNPISSNDSSEILTNDEFYSSTQALFRNDNYKYDTNVKTDADNPCLYFYIDIPEKKTRAVCFDSYNSKYTNEQMKWLADEVLTVKDEGWKYVFLMHIPIDIRYEAGMTHEASGANDIKALVTALNNRTTATGTFGTKDFSDFKSNVTAINFGHVHNSYMEYNSDLGAVCIATGQGGWVGDGTFDIVEPDDWHKWYREDTINPDAFLFDIISTDAEKTTRIRFGNGSNKTVSAK